jgi:hypothetical protein
VDELPKGKVEIDAASERHESLFRMLFQLSWHRIWSSRILRGWEISVWMILAVYLGFHTGGTVFSIFDMDLSRSGYWIPIVATPFVIPVLVFKSFRGITDLALHTVPLTTKQIFHPRFAAVLLSWLRLFAPVVIISVLADIFDRQASYFLTDVPFWQFWVFAFKSHLQFQPYHIDSMTLLRSHDFLILTWAPVWMKALILILGLCQAISWVTLPIMWGFWIANRFSPKSWAFSTFYFSWLLMPAFLWFTNGRLFPEAFMRMFAGQTYDLSMIKMIYSMSIVGISGVIATLVFYDEALKSFERRDG